MNQIDPSLVKIAHFQQNCAGRQKRDGGVMICPSVVHDHVQQRAVDAQTAVVFGDLHRPGGLGKALTLLEPYQGRQFHANFVQNFCGNRSSGVADRAR
jgi:hypothetical protein